MSYADHEVTTPTIHEPTGLTMAELHHQQRTARQLPDDLLRAAAPQPTPFARLGAVSANGWLSQAYHVNLSGNRGNGPFPNGLHGVVLHVNASGKGSQGTSPDWYKNGGGPDEVCPNFQVMRNGTIYQLLPMDWEPWTQADGNSWGASIETGGDPSEPLSPQQVAACVTIMAAYHQRLSVPLQLANSVSARGFGTHGMGGAAWGGHTGCPGTIRAGQRAGILTSAGAHPVDPLEEVMAMYPNREAFESAMLTLMKQAVREQPVTVNSLLDYAHTGYHSHEAYDVGHPNYKTVEARGMDPKHKAKMTEHGLAPDLDTDADEDIDPGSETA